MAPDSIIVNGRAIDLSPFAVPKRRLVADPKAWIETHHLIAELKQNAREPIPQVVLDHLSDRLDGKARKRRGRGRPSPSRKMRNLLIAAWFDTYENWLKARQAKHGLEGWSAIRDADWWQGPPSERAAHMTKRKFELNIGWEAIRNIAYDIHKNGPR